MNTFEYHAATSLAEALDLLTRYGEDAHLIAGGTSMVLMMQQGLLQPGHVIGLRGISTLRGIQTMEDGGLEIRACTTHREIERSPAVQAYCPAVAETFSHIATVRIRNQATLGGNLIHADPAQDPPPMLLALGAHVVVAGSTGERSIPLDELFVDFFETTVREGEILTALRLPPLPAGNQATYVKFLPRTHDDYATVAVGAWLHRDADGYCQDVRIGLGALATIPLRARAVEDALRGERLTPQLVREAAALVRDEVDPLDDVRGSAAYKREMARVWTERALLRLLNSPSDPQQEIIDQGKA